VAANEQAAITSSQLLDCSRGMWAGGVSLPSSLAPESCHSLALLGNPMARDMLRCVETSPQSAAKGTTLEQRVALKILWEIPRTVSATGKRSFFLKFCPRSGRGRWPHTLKNPCFFDPMPKFKWIISRAPKNLDRRNQIAQPTNSNPRSQRSTSNDVPTHAEPSAHRSSSWWCRRNSQHAGHTHDSRLTGDSAARQRRCVHALSGCQGRAPPRGGHVSISGLK